MRKCNEEPAVRNNNCQCMYCASAGVSMWKSHHLLCKGLLCLLLSLSQQAVALGGALEAVLSHDGLHHALVPQPPDALKVFLCQYPPILQKVLWSTTSA